MNNDSKLMLSDEELYLVNNSDWILTKRIIIDKVNGLLGSLANDMQDAIEKEKAWLPAPIVFSTPKISKGENYLQLPYLILDYPRCFNDNNIFAIRTMFWWGNYFSMTVLLSGIYKEMYQQKIIETDWLADEDFFICINESQWHHHFEADNYTAINNLGHGDFEKLIAEKFFIKLAVKFPLQQWNNIPTLLEKSFNTIIIMLKN